jgi:hypothetical protein
MGAKNAASRRIGEDNSLFRQASFRERNARYGFEPSSLEYVPMSTNGSGVPSAPRPPREPAKPREPPSEPVATAPTPLPRTKRFWNWKLISLELLVTAMAGYAFLTRAPKFPGMAGFVVGLLGLWLLSREYRGIAVNAKMISLPTGRLRALPIVYSGRRKVHPDSVRELTVTAPWYSFQIVHIQGDFGSEVLIFQSRGQRRRFMNIIEKICPNVQMYRKIPPPPAPL